MSKGLRDLLRESVAGHCSSPGGANFSGDVKIWSEEVFILESPEAVWRVAGKLPGPLGYGVSVTYGDALLCIGGSDATQHHRKVLCLRWRRGALEKSELAPLPRALANACGAVVGDELYIAGGAPCARCDERRERFLGSGSVQTRCRVEGVGVMARTRTDDGDSGNLRREFFPVWWGRAQ